MARISKYPDSAGVYKLTCLITNKIYIGKSFNIRKRLNDHKCIGRCKKSNYHLAHAILKYGWDNFSVEILEIIHNFDKLRNNDNLLKKEAYYIELFDSTNQDKGYNILKFSTDRTGMTTVHTPEAKEKMRQAALGRKHTEETKEKIRNNKLGLKHSEETKEKIRQGNKGKFVSDKTKEKLRKPKNYIRSEKHTEKWRESYSGYKHSEETKEKMRLGHLKRKQNIQTECCLEFNLLISS
jgi:group I intron endonuclease